ncbi:MAG: serine/threonine protein kinase [Proteobacteria bacterium]|nr:serine/threonine protein kinase [Cystobacterineae bacterium]MCL2258539.1 serine/threonine protein kinase [Cystobacterineae bacterium]MCL2315124.1 serine/threonine protein kinase [Pseudomonadota bacterium]
MAEIFLARQEGLEGFEKTVVIKRIRPHLSSQSNFVRMFLNEARLAAQLTHPNIVQIYDLGKINDSYYIAMEYISGRDMRKIIAKAQARGIGFPLEYALKIASSVCEGLYYAHQKTDAQGVHLNIVHRDVTPENIFVSFDGTVKILDFGIAKASNQIIQTDVGEVKGKLSYMSPEQCCGYTLDGRNDIFSLGVVLYECLTGFKLFTGDSEAAVVRSIIDGKIYSPSYFMSDIPQGAEEILMKALEKNRENRYQSAWEMQSAINTFLSRHEFNPSNTHLANFLKQLFDDELKANTSAQVAALKVPENRMTTGEIEAWPFVSFEEEGSSIYFVLSADVFAKVEKVAKLHGMDISELAKRIVEDWAKYR